MTKAWSELYQKLEDWWVSVIKILPNLGIAVLVLVLTVFLSFRLKKIAVKIMNKFSENKAVNRLISAIMTVVIVIIGLFISLGVLGLDKIVTSLLAGAGVAGLAIGLAFQEPLINTISGIVLAVRKNIRLSEHIDSNGYNGKVKGVNLRETIIETFEGQMVIIPNKSVIQNPLINYTRYEKRRVDLECGISYGENLENVAEIAKDAIRKIAYVQNDSIDLMYTGFGDSSINFTLRYWLENTSQPSFLHAVSDGIISLKAAFDKNDILIPFPIRTLDFDAKGGKELKEMLVSDKRN